MSLGRLGDNLRLEHSGMRGVALAVFCTALAAGLRWLLDPLLGDVAQYTLFYLAVAITAANCGLSGGLLALALGGAAGFWLFVLRSGPHPLTSRHFMQLGLYLLVGGLISYCANRVRRQQSHADAVAQFPAKNPNPVLRISAEGRVLYFNRASVEMFSDWDWSVGALAPPALRQRATTALAHGRMDRFDLPAADGRTSLIVCFPIPQEQHVNVYGMDVTEARRAEEALRQQERDLQLIMDCSPALISYIDADFHYRRVNRRYELWFGRPAAQMQGRHCREVLGDAAWETVRPHMERALAGEIVTYEAELLYAGTGPRWVQVSYIPDTDPAGRVRGFVTHVIDIAQRKTAEAAIRESEERFRTLADNISQLAWMTDPTGSIIWYNRRWYDYTGTTFEQMQGWGWQAVHHPEHVQRVTEKFRQHLQSGAIWEDTFPLRGAAGQFRWFLSRAIPIRDTEGNITRWFGTNTDVTELREAQEAQRESQEALRLVFDSVYEGILIHSREGRVIDANERFLEMYGLARDELAGVTIAQISASTMPLHTLNGLWQSVLAGETRLFEWRARRRDGSEFDVEVFLRKIPLRGQEVILANIRDIAQRKAIEAQLRTASAVAEEASQAKDRFLAVLSHELRTPLTPALAMAGMLEADASLPPHLRQDITTMRRNIELEARLIDDLLDVTRIARGKLELNCRPVPLTDVVRAAVEVCRREIEAGGQVFSFDPGDGNPMINADPVRLQQVFWNLLKNSIKFTPPGGRIEVRCASNGDQLATVEITDSGEGIDADVLPRLFRAFEQGSAQITRQFGGLGLGLTISKGLVEMHGGQITVRSDGKGKGATFSILLPRVELPGVSAARSDVARSPDSEISIRARGLHILLVEDHVDTARIIRRVLTAAGHDVQLAHDSGSAMEAAEQQRFDLLISDLGLPDGHGCDLMQQLHSKQRIIHGIALSGYGQEDDLLRSRAAGFARHLTKPVSARQLLEAVAEISGRISTHDSADSSGV